MEDEIVALREKKNSQEVRFHFFFFFKRTSALQLNFNTFLLTYIYRCNSLYIAIYN